MCCPVSASLVSVKGYVLQEDNEPKHTAKNTKDRLGTKHWTILKWRLELQSKSHWSSEEKSWNVQFGEGTLRNLKQLEQFEEWAELHVGRCRSLRVTGVTWLEWLSQKVVQQNITLKVLSFLSMQVSFAFPKTLLNQISIAMTFFH